MIIIPFKYGYFIGNIPYFQTNPCRFSQNLHHPRLFEHRVEESIPVGVEAGKVLWLGESAHLWQIALQYIQKYPEKVLNQSCSWIAMQVCKSRTNSGEITWFDPILNDGSGKLIDETSFWVWLFHHDDSGKSQSSYGMFLLWECPPFGGSTLMLENSWPLNPLPFDAGPPVIAAQASLKITWFLVVHKPYL